MQIAEVKNYFASHRDQYQEQYQKVEAQKEDHCEGFFLFKAPRLNDKSEIIAMIPSKPVVDRLVARYFDSYDPAIHIIHGPTFQTQYNQHWMDPAESSVAFYALLYAIMTLSLQSYHRAADEPPEYRGKTLELSVSFRRITAQCLVLADTSLPMPQMLEALLLHLQAEHSRSKDAETGVLMISCLCVRMAMRMGYHRDPRPHPAISPFQGEMRRRVWTYVRMVDLMVSFQFGLPSMIRTDCIDIEVPRNLFDDELQEDMKELPPSRPDTEITPMSYMIAKARLTHVFGKIVDRIQSIHMQPSYDEVMKLDAELREARDATPDHLKPRSVQESPHDPANLIMERYGLELIYLKSQCVLHRRFIARGRDSQRYAYSRRTCIDASMEMLAHQSTLHHEAQPGGRLRSVKWFMSSLTTHDFLLAAMVVCLDLYHCSEAERLGNKPSVAASPMDSEGRAADRKLQMMNALRHCVGIWDSLRDQSMEAYKASTTLRVMLEKLMAQQQYAMPGGAQQAMGWRRNSRHAAYGAFPNGSVADVDDGVPPEHSAAMTLGLLSAGGVSPNTGFTGSGMQGLGMDGKHPASMAGLLSEAMNERSGLTPQYNGADGVGQAVAGGVSPFSQMFNSTGNAAGPDGEVDWVSWQS